MSRRFVEDAAHASYAGVEVLRDLTRTRGGERVLAPVVFTSALNWASCSRREVRECFGQAVWIISQGPQVWLDAQVAELEGGLLVNWDAREEVFPPGVLDAMFCAYEKLIADLITDEDPWNRPVTSLLPDEQRQARASR